MNDSNRKAKRAKRNSSIDHSFELPRSDSSATGSDDEVEVMEEGANKKNSSRVSKLSEVLKSPAVIVDELREKVLAIPSVGSGKKNSKKKSDASKGATSNGTPKKSENSKSREKKRPASENNHPPAMSEETNPTGNEHPQGTEPQPLSNPGDFEIKWISARKSASFSYDSVGPQEAILHVTMGTEIDLFDYGAIAMYGNRLFAKVHPSQSRDATIKSLGYISYHSWAINELAKKISSEPTGRWCLPCATLGNAMLIVYSMAPTLTISEVYINGIRAYLNGITGPNTSDAEDKGRDFITSFGTGKAMEIEEEYNSEVEIMRLP